MQCYVRGTLVRHRALSLILCSIPLITVRLWLGEALVDVHDGNNNQDRPFAVAAVAQLEPTGMVTRARVALPHILDACAALPLQTNHMLHTDIVLHMQSSGVYLGNKKKSISDASTALEQIGILKPKVR